MKLKNIDSGKIWAKSDHGFKSYGHFLPPHSSFGLGSFGVRLFGEPEAPGFVVRRTQGPERMRWYNKLNIWRVENFPNLKLQRYEMNSYLQIFSKQKRKLAGNKLSAPMHCGFSLRFP